LRARARPRKRQKARVLWAFLHFQTFLDEKCIFINLLINEKRPDFIKILTIAIHWLSLIRRGIYRQTTLLRGFALATRGGARMGFDFATEGREAVILPVVPRCAQCGLRPARLDEQAGCASSRSSTLASSEGGPRLSPLGSHGGLRKGAHMSFCDRFAMTSIRAKEGASELDGARAHAERVNWRRGPVCPWRACPW